MFSFLDLANAGTAVLCGGPTEPRTASREYFALAINAKVTELRQRGFRVAPAYGPIGGLWEVSGHPELTTAQLMSL